MATLSYRERSFIWKARGVMHGPLFVIVLGLYGYVSGFRAEKVPDRIWIPTAILSTFLLFRIATGVLSFVSPTRFIQRKRTIVITDGILMNGLLLSSFLYPAPASPGARNAAFECVMAGLYFVIMETDRADLLLLTALLVPSFAFCDWLKQPPSTTPLQYLPRGAVVAIIGASCPLVLQRLMSFGQSGRYLAVDGQLPRRRPPPAWMMVATSSVCAAFVAYEMAKQVKAARQLDRAAASSTDEAKCAAPAGEVMVSMLAAWVLGNMNQLQLLPSLVTSTDLYRSLLHMCFPRHVASAMERRELRRNLLNNNTLVLLVCYFFVVLTNFKQFSSWMPMCAAVGFSQATCSCPSSPVEVITSLVATVLLGSMEKQALVDAMQRQLASYQRLLHHCMPPGVLQALMANNPAGLPQPGGGFDGSAAGGSGSAVSPASSRHPMTLRQRHGSAAEAAAAGAPTPGRAQ